MLEPKIEVPASFHGSDAVRVKGFNNELCQRASTPAQGLIDGRCEASGTRLQVLQVLSPVGFPKVISFPSKRTLGASSPRSQASSLSGLIFSLLATDSCA